MAGCKIREQAIVLWAERFCARRWAKGLRLRFFLLCGWSCGNALVVWSSCWLWIGLWKWVGASLFLLSVAAAYSLVVFVQLADTADRDDARFRLRWLAWT